MEEIIYSDIYIKITKEADDYFIESFTRGMSMDAFNQIMGKNTQIQIISFLAVKNAILYAPYKKTKFAEVKERIIVEISNDNLKAYITLCVGEYELIKGKNIDLIKEILKKITEKGIVFGVKQEALLADLVNGEKILIAEGTPPVNGEDSQVKMFELKDPKPDIKEDGKVNHYELSLINRVNAGDWLGERIDPTSGISGKSVKGNLIMAMPGKKYPLLYDKNSVKEVHNDGVTTLLALRSGAVNYEGDKITVSNHLEIPENVDFKTGNIDFDGYLTVKGSIEDNFTVAADNDVEILGDYGVGSIKEIVSREGSIYIKGGIAGKNKSVIRSKKDIYTKFVSDAIIICEGKVHIGFYCLNSTIIAKEVILDSPKGQIMGGNIEADIRIVSTVIGSPSEIKTQLCINGFERTALKENYEKACQIIEHLKNEQIKAKQEMSIYPTSSLDNAQMIAYEAIKEKYFLIKNQLKFYEDEKKTLNNYLRSRGEGEIQILKKAFPNTSIEIKRCVRDINKVILATTFYYSNDQINEV